MLIFAELYQIDDNPYQSRQEYGDIAELAADILRHAQERPDTLGLQQIPNGRLVDDDGALVPIANLDTGDWLDTNDNLLSGGWRVQLEFGHRRKRAFEYLQKGGAYEYYQMPVIMRDLDEDHMLNGVWTENRARRNLSAVEEAELLARKLERSSSQREVAEAWGLNRATVANRLRLLTLPAEIQQANRAGQLSERQALSLAPIVKLQENCNNNTEWETNTAHAAASGYGWPPEPGEYIAYAIENNPTSEEIRAIAKRQLARAGHDLPRVVAKFEIADVVVNNIRQSVCKGCPMRVNDTCLDNLCLADKKGIFIECALAAAAEELEVEVSDRPEDFADSHGYGQSRERLRRAWERRSDSDSNFVISWASGSGVRPFAEDGDWVGESGMFDNGRSGILLGHRGDLPGAAGQENEEESASAAYKPAPADLAAWNTAAKKSVTAAKRTATEWMKEQVFLGVVGLNVVQALINEPGLETDGEEQVVVEKLVTFLWKRGAGVETYHAAPWQNYDSIRAMLERAGAETAVLSTGSPDDDLTRDAVLALDFFWHGDLSWVREEADGALTAVYERVVGASHGHGGEVGRLETEVGLAMDRIDADE